MPNAKPLILLGALGALAACSGQSNPDQNVIITDNVPANADIEALPPDESSATPTDELQNGDDNSDVNEIDSNGY
jgi:hypothetical protein